MDTNIFEKGHAHFQNALIKAENWHDHVEHCFILPLSMQIIKNSHKVKEILF